MEDLFARCDEKHRKLIYENRGGLISVGNRDAMLDCNAWDHVVPSARVWYLIADFRNAANERSRVSEECQSLIDKSRFKATLDECLA